ncbi:hypothetical protein SRHO_G00101920 [Serrasalmus rhombeus]
MAEADGKAGCGRQGALAVGLSQPAGWRSLLSITILFLAWLAGFSSRLFAVIRFESVIHEFDPCVESDRGAETFARYSDIAACFSSFSPELNGEEMLVYGMLLRS